MGSRVIITALAAAALLSGNALAAEPQKERAIVCIIGTEHDPTDYINPDTIFSVLEKVRPDAILCELESRFLTGGHSLNVEQYPDLLSTNENIAAQRYHEQYGVPLYPYDIEGRNEYYASTGYFGNVRAMFTIFSDSYRSDSLSAESTAEWKMLMMAIPAFDVFGTGLYELNTPIKTAYSEVKNILTHHTLLSVAARDFPEWEETALEILLFWERRNDAMAANIYYFADRHPMQTIVVLCGQQHKAPLIQRLRGSPDLELKEYWELERP